MDYRMPMSVIRAVVAEQLRAQGITQLEQATTDQLLQPLESTT